MNLALGSALASIGLTIPAVAAVSLIIGQPLSLGLDSKETVLLGLTLLVSVITLGTGRTTVLQGIVHLVMAPTDRCAGATSRCPRMAAWSAGRMSRLSSLST